MEGKTLHLGFEENKSSNGWGRGQGSKIKEMGHKRLQYYKTAGHVPRALSCLVQSELKVSGHLIGDEIGEYRSGHFMY